jgi:RimJ/RimL family protein N-acetyltransferase
MRRHSSWRQRPQTGHGVAPARSEPLSGGGTSGESRRRCEHASNVRVSVIETERLRLEPWNAEHAALLTRLSSLPEVTRFIGKGTPMSAAEADELATRVAAHWRAHGFGWRGAVERTSGRAVGLVALERARDVRGLADGDHEIGWWFDPEVWGKGYATEGARAIVAEAWALGAPSVVARIQPDNIASARVAAKLGLTFEADTTGRFGEPVRILRLYAPATRGGDTRG